MYGFRLTAGIDWGFRKKFLEIPVPWSFYAHPYANSEQIKGSAGYAGPKEKSLNNVRLGAGIKIEIVPVLELSAGLGIGVDASVVSADFGVSFPVTLFLPISTTIGFVYDMYLNPFIFNEFEVDFGARFDFAARANIKFPLVDNKQFTWNLFNLADYNAIVMKARFENFKCTEFVPFTEIKK